MLAAAALAGRCEGGEDRGDRDKIQGTWTIVAGEKAGQQAPADVVKEGRMTFSDGKFTWKMGDRQSEGTFTLDGGKTPGQITLTLGGKTLGGIYRLAGDDLELCVGAGDERPAGFTSEAGAKTVLLVLKRSTP